MTTRTCLVTGAGRGIGRAVAIRLAQLGHRVALTSRSEDELRETAAQLAGPALVVPADITASVEDVFDRVEAEWGLVDVLVANAGGGASAPLGRTSDEIWQSQLDINLTAPFRCTRRAVPPMVEQGWGRVVVVASMAAKHGEAYLTAYCAAKHGVLGMVRAVAAEVVRSGVTVNAVCPAYVDTPMTDQSVATIAEKTGKSMPDARAFLEGKQPIGRLITVDEVADVVLLCVGNGAITGQGINVDGGAVQS